MGGASIAYHLTLLGWRDVVVVERSELTAQVRGVGAVVVGNTRGDVHLKPSADGQLHLAVTKIVHMPSSREARSLAARTTVQAGVNARSFFRNPTSCGPKTPSLEATSWADNPTTDTTAMTP